MKRAVLITGVDGFIGGALTAEYGKRGWAVHGLARNARGKRLPAGLAGAFEYSLESGPEPRALELEPGVVIHAAFQTKGNLSMRDLPACVDSALRMADLAAERGALFVFVSSMSAHDAALSAYGRIKREIERRLDPRRTLAVRPGFVMGAGGIFQRACRTLRSATLVPMPFGGNNPLQTADAAELARAVFEFSEARTTGLYNFGEPEPIPIGEFYRGLGGWLGKRLILLPCPGAPVLAAVRALEAVGIPLPLTSENLLGLQGLIHQPVEPAIQALGWRPAPFSEILKRYTPGEVLGTL